MVTVLHINLPHQQLPLPSQYKCFLGPIDLITLIYAKFKNQLHIFVAPQPHIDIKFNQNQTC